MKFLKNLNLQILLLVKVLLSISYTLCNEEKRDNSFNTFHLSQLIFGKDKPIADLELKNRIHANVLYETWEVLRQEKDGRRPYIAHIFKYNLSDKFPLQNADLKLFCLRINDFNIEMKKKNLGVRSLPCHDYKVHNKTINDGVVSYVLIQKPKPGDPFVDLCKRDSDLIRACRYMIKDFIKGFLNAHSYSVNSNRNFDVYFPVNKYGFYYGKKGKITDHITQQNSEIREILIMDKQRPIDQEMQNEDDLFYLMIPFFRFFSPETVSTQDQTVDPAVKLIQNKQTMVYFGKLLLNMYKGLNPERENGFYPADGSFNPNLMRMQNFTDVYLSMHTNDQTGKHYSFFDDQYMGFTQDYITKLRAFLSGTLINQQKVKEMDESLANSYAGFISKLVNFDDKNESQFDTIENALSHPFLTSNIPDKLIRSDTSYEQ